MLWCQAMTLVNRVVVIIGATGHLGSFVAKAFADAGAKLVLVGTHQEALASLAQTLGYPDSRVWPQAVDALDSAAMETLARDVQARFERVDILLHLAGTYLGGGILDTPDEIWERLFDVNLRTALYSIRAFLPRLVENDWGRIITISSGVTQNPPANSIAYVSAKAALETLTLAVANQVKTNHITANTVLIRALASRSDSAEIKPGSVKPEEVAATLLFLCSDEGGAITGARIPVFGGN